MQMIIPGAVAAVIFTSAMAACSSDSSDSPSCREVLTQSSYEVMRQLAAAGLAADPAALRQALPGATASSTEEAVQLPEYRVLVKQFSDAERAELLSALSSRTTGVGAVFDEQSFYAATSRAGDCAGWMTSD